jgi:osmoprotectant transport system permease protein
VTEFLRRNGGLLVDGLVHHVVLTVIAVAVGFALALVLTLLIVRWRRLGGPVLATTGTMYTIPSLALFAFLVPFTGLSLLTAEIGLISYTLLILVRNTLAGLDGVSPDVREAADGLGHTRMQRLLRVELPLAVPLLIAGLRIATVTTIGLVMVTAVIGEGGLGQVMLRGFNLRNWGLVYAALVVMVLLAVGADVLLSLMGRVLTPWARKDAR